MTFRGSQFDVAGGTYFAFSPVQLFVVLTRSVSLSLRRSPFCSHPRFLSLPSVSLTFFIPLVDDHCLNRVIEYLRPAVHRRALGTCARAKTRRRDPVAKDGSDSRHFAVFASLSPRSVKRDVPARNDARARDWCSSRRCLLDPKPRILLPGFAPGAISACLPAASQRQTDRVYGVSGKRRRVFPPRFYSRHAHGLLP